jgi:flagellar basal-body rod modification protein FlgD
MQSTSVSSTLSADSGSVISTRREDQSQKKDATLGYDAFLQLLVAQMQNQNPLEPAKSSDYVAQLATFSQVEKTVQMNDNVAALLSAARLQQAEGIVGKTLTSADGSISGVVSASKIVGNDVVAYLPDGREITLASGVRISGADT